ncbi:hypothetical protein BJ508DRAFT_329553 [Ascobolus immersus RN42]|uniref:Uncharacterized protein n=1 Tax=Ascobolus immersus RN42 TaxID=1160509 RepID=A0A3N4I8Q7_ASCIM|nr:hypothetical protein BJ508DRAFT_329553 [Ascobolus immersus RN42]
MPRPNLPPYPPTPSKHPFLHPLTSRPNRLTSHFWHYELQIPIFRLHTLSGPATLPELLSPGPNTQLYLEILYEHPSRSWLGRKKQLCRVLLGLWVVVKDGLATTEEYYPAAMARLWGVPGPEASSGDDYDGDGCGGGGSLCLGCNPKSPLARLPRSCESVGCNGQSVDGIEGRLCVFEVLRVMEIERLLREERGKIRWWRRRPVPAAWGVSGFPLRHRCIARFVDARVRITLAMCLDPRLLFVAEQDRQLQMSQFAAVMYW